jgi:hypothetical protein
METRDNGLAYIRLVFLVLAMFVCALAWYVFAAGAAW